MPEAGGRRARGDAPMPSWRRAGARALVLLCGVLLPLLGFRILAGHLQAPGALPFDVPLLQQAQAASGPVLDRVFLLFSELGYGWGVVPGDILLVVLLLCLRRWRQGAFAALATGGSALLNMGSKRLFARDRPALWESIAPDATWSFPSGHAMGSMALALVLVLLAWPTRWRWPVLAAMAVFVPMVGASRVYLGVHYPSDILAGWAAAAAWVFACWWLLMARAARVPPTTGSVRR